MCSTVHLMTYLAVSFHSSSPSSSSRSSSISENSGWGSWAGSFWSSPRMNCTLWAGGVTARKQRESGVFRNNLADNKHSHADFLIFSRILCIIRISICDRGLKFTCKSRWLSRIHVHFFSLAVEHWHSTFSIYLRKNYMGICSTFCQFGPHTCQHLLVAKNSKANNNQNLWMYFYATNKCVHWLGIIRES